MKTVTQQIAETPAEKLAAKLTPSLPNGFYATVGLMVNMADPSSDAPEMTLVSPTREVYRSHRVGKTLDLLKEKTRMVYASLRGYGGDWSSITMDGCTIYLRPNLPADRVASGN